MLAFCTIDKIDLVVNGQSGLAHAQVVFGSYFPMLGVHAVIGRAIGPDDDKSANPVAVISYDYWRKRFALDPSVIGKHVVINNSLFTIVGVTPPGFFGLQPGEPVDLSMPITTMADVEPGCAMAGKIADVLTAPFRNWLRVMGRLKPGITKEKASASLQPVFH